jgi:hypothetical protein
LLNFDENTGVRQPEVANCKAQERDPEDYLIEVLKLLPHNVTMEQSAGLPPRNIAAESNAKAALEATQVA